LKGARYKFLPDLRPDIWKCNKCGACHSVCPLYLLTRDESMSARGRLALIEALLEDAFKPGVDYRNSLYNCLMCQACVFQCASGVPADAIFLAARRELARRRKHSPVLRLALEALSRPRLMKFLAVVSGFFRGKKKIGSLLAAGGAQLLSGEFRGAVGYFTGCAADLFLPRISPATRRVLACNGWGVASPQNCCCGMPHQMYGDFSKARALAKKNIDLFASLEIIITDCPTCGAALKGYKHLLADDEEYGERAGAFSAKVRDICEFLDQTGLRTTAGIKTASSDCPVPARPDTFSAETFTFTYHDPCHLVRGQGVRLQPRKILEMMTGGKLIEMADPGACCGGGGSFLCTHPELAKKIGEAKAKTIAATGAKIVATGCPGCLIQLKLSLSRQNRDDIQAVHPVELLDRYYRGVTGQNRLPVSPGLF